MAGPTIKVRWGILSTARINDAILAGAAESDEVDVLAVASRDRARAEEYARERGIARAYGSYDELLGDPDIEAVYNPLPNSMHVPWSLRALEAGKHVLCEKPLTRRPEEVDELFDAADRAGLFVMEAFMYRHSPRTRRMKALVDEGVIGRLRLVRAHFSFTLSRLDDHRLEAEYDGGSLMDVGCYPVSTVRLLAGEPERVYGEQVLNERGVDVRFAGTMRLPGDVLAHFDAAFDLPRREEVEIAGDEGTIIVADPWISDRPALELRHGKEVEHFTFEPASSYRLELENLSAAIRGRADPLLGRADALGQARAIDTLYRSAETGRPAEL